MESENNAAPENAQQQKRFKRKLTPFLCQEMLYDYATDQLDPERRLAVEEFLKTDRECQEILESIRKGLDYASVLSRTELKSEIVSHVLESENALSLGRRYSSWMEWPEVLRWSITAILVSTTVAGLIAIVPWQHLSMFRFEKKSDVIEIAEIPGSQDGGLKAAEEGEVAHTEEGSGDLPPDGVKVAANEAEEEGSGDDHHDDASVAPPVAVAPNPAKAAKEPSVAVVATNAAKGQQKPEIKVAAQTAEPSSQGESTVGETAGAESMSASSKKESKPKGFVYRAFMTLSDLEEVAPKIATEIRELGGEKAGDVELGWKRGTGRYYHFSLPEVNEKKVLEKLQVYGPVRISKDPHPRVMPEGQIRFILWVESAN